MELESGWIEIGSGEQTFAAYRVRPAAADRLAARGPGHSGGLGRRCAHPGHGRAPGHGRLPHARAGPLLGGRPAAGLAPERVAAVKGFLETVPPAVWSDPAGREQALSALPVDEGASGSRAQWPCCSAGWTHDSTSRRWTMRSARCSTTRRATGTSGRSAGASAAACRRGSRAASRASGPPSSSTAQRRPTTRSGDRVSGARPLWRRRHAHLSDGAGLSPAMARAGVAFEHHIYPDAPHAFFNDTRRSYRAGAARDAWARCLTFFAAHLADRGSLSVSANGSVAEPAVPTHHVCA